MPELNIIGAKEENRYFPYQNAFRVTRESFYLAGQDSFTDPPAQNPDMFQALVNTEPVTQGNLQRRRGYTLFSSQNPAIPFNEGYAFRNESLGLRRLVWTSESTVLAVDESGNVISSSLFVPSLNADTVRMVLSRNYGYFSDGAVTDFLKWDGTVPANATIAGPSAPTAASDTGSSWSNVTNVEVSDAAYATASISWLNGTYTDTSSIFASAYGFSIPATATITGITVTVQGYYTLGSGTSPMICFAQLTKASAAAGFPSNQYNFSAGPPEVNTVIYGSTSLMSPTPNPLWGTTWTPADINDSGFGVFVSFGNRSNSLGGSADFYVDYISITVNYTPQYPGLTKWGIAAGQVTALTAGPNYCGTAANQSGYTSWTNPTYAEGAPDGQFAIDNTGGSGLGLLCTNYGFSVSPTNAVVTGITVQITGYQDVPTGFIYVNPLKAGAVYGTPKQISLPPTTGFIELGGYNDDWGGNWLGSDINDSGFGFQINAQVTSSGLINFAIDSIQITVYISGNPITVTPGAPSSGNITLLNGRVYTISFLNSATGTTSDLFPFSQSTGPLTSQNVVLTGIPVSTDPQVDTVLILATADGGDETTLYLCGEVTNGTTTFTDNTPDALSSSASTGNFLLGANIYQETDANGNLFGIANNDPPPAGLSFPLKHKGRIYGAVGPTLYFSKNLTDVTTSTSTITTKWEEAWPAYYSMDLSEYDETVTGLLSDGQTLYIATDASIRTLTGDSPNNFSVPQVVFNDTGVLNQEVWKVVFAEGQPVGSMWLTPNNRVMFSDFNSYQDIGTPIQNILNSINVNVAMDVCHADFVSQGPSEYYMLYIATGSNTAPDTACVYDMRTKRWTLWTPTDSPTASLFNISANGSTQWLFATQAGPLYYWDSTVRQDRNGNTPNSYAATGVTSWLDFGDMGLTKALNKMLVTTGDTMLTIGVQGAIRDSDLDGGGVLVMPASTLQQEIFGDLFLPLVGQPGGYKWFQFTFTSPPSTIQDVLEAFDIEVMPSMRM